MGYVHVYDLILLSKYKNKHSDLVTNWYGRSLFTTLMTDIFPNLMLELISLKTRKHLYTEFLLSFTIFPHDPQFFYHLVQDIFAW